MIAYLDDFHLMMLMTLLSMPLLLFVRSASKAAVRSHDAVLE